MIFVHGLEINFYFYNVIYIYIAFFLKTKNVDIDRY